MKKLIECKRTNETFTTYSAYMKSKQWQGVKKRFKESKLARNCCWVCDDTKNLHMHHKSYKRIGNEYLNDLVELCEKCHFELHDILADTQNIRKNNNWSVVRKMRKKVINRKKNKSARAKKKSFTKIKNKKNEDRAFIKETQKKCPADIKYEAQKKLTKNKNGIIVRKK